MQTLVLAVLDIDVFDALFFARLILLASQQIIPHLKCSSEGKVPSKRTQEIGWLHSWWVVSEEFRVVAESCSVI